MTIVSRPSLGTPELLAVPSDPPITPETLALMPPDEANAAVTALSPAQRTTQAIAQASWLASFGYPVGPAEILASWTAGTRTA